MGSSMHLGRVLAATSRAPDGRYRTVSLPCIPAWRWPSTEQKKV